MHLCKNAILTGKQFLSLSLKEKKKQQKTHKHVREIFMLCKNTRFTLSQAVTMLLVAFSCLQSAFSFKQTTFKSSGCTSVFVRPCQRDCEKVNMEVTGDISNSTVTSFIYM